MEDEDLGKLEKFIYELHTVYRNEFPISCVYNNEEYQKELGCELDDPSGNECIFLEEPSPTNFPYRKSSEKDILLESFSQALDIRFPPCSGSVGCDPDDFKLVTTKDQELVSDIEIPIESSPNDSFREIPEQSSQNASRKQSDGDDIRIC